MLRERVIEFKNTQMPFTIVCKTEDEANAVDMTLYRLERFSDTRNAWIFVRRAV